MLVLTMKEGEFLQIGDDIRVYLDCTAGDDALAVAIEAPQSEKILRGKLYEQLNPQMKNAGVPHRRNTKRRRTHVASNVG